MLRRVMQVATLVTAVLGMGVVGAGCLDRPITSANPTLKTNFTVAQQANTIDKIDLLFDIDNSASMGDKQAYLEQAVPDLVNRLVTPNCVNSTTGAVAGSSSSTSCGATCANCAGSSLEFPAVHNMHIGIISSSLGTRGVTGGGNVCDPTSSAWNTTGMFADGQPALNTHVDDQAHLLFRAAGSPNAAEDEVASLSDLGGQGFLDWFPPVTANTGKTATGGITQLLSPQATVLTNAGGLGEAGTLEGDFGLMVQGVHNYGCGIESQLETWYRFLVQPDPYASISTAGGKAAWVGVDTTILQQRHDFLRPDSLVAIIVLTDENDSEIDVRSVGGGGYLFMDTDFNPPGATCACAANPASAQCQSCDAPGASGDSCCKAKPSYSADNDWGYYINVRHVHMQQKYGFSPQFPLQRYLLGLTSPTVPDRSHEYPAGAGSYQGGTNGDPDDLYCLNPLFAATLPDGSDTSEDALCQRTSAGVAAQGPRSANLIFYAHIGGVPHQILQAVPGVDKDTSGNVICPMGTAQADCPQKDTLSVTDWTKILGNGTASGGNPYDYTGIDPHMIEDYQVGRTGSNYATGAAQTIVPVAPASYPTGGGIDPINGGDWATNVNTPNPHDLPVDREYACIFPLTTPAGEANPRDCSQANDPVDSYACDCGAVGLTGTQVPPLCGLQNGGGTPSACSALGSCATSNDYLKQYYAKAYPTIRELTLAQMMGAQGIISSLCPIHVTDHTEAGDDPVYGYRPAVTAIIDRLKNALASQCLPQPLHPVMTSTGLQVPCLVLASLNNTPASEEATACNDPAQGLSVPAADVLSTFKTNAHAQYMTAQTGTDLSTLATCEVNQISVSPGTDGNSGTCVGGTSEGWCYVTGKTAGSCDTQAILFTPGTPPNGAVVNLQCILQNQGDGG
jgi:hypothetical protein